MPTDDENEELDDGSAGGQIRWSADNAIAPPAASAAQSGAPVSWDTLFTAPGGAPSAAPGAAPSASPGAALGALPEQAPSPWLQQGTPQASNVSPSSEPQPDKLF